MKKQLPGVIAILILAMTACAQSKKVKSDVSANTSDLNIKYLSMERTACFGTCPMYKIELFEDGKVIYTGQMYATPEGTYEKNIGAEKVKAILDKFENYRVDTCQNEYEMLISDLPGLIYIIKSGNKTKQINNAHFGPDFLKRLGKIIDEAVKPDDTWKKTADYKKE